MDVYQKALRNPDSPNKSNSHSRTPLIDSGRKVSFIPGVPSINQIRQEPRLLQPMQPLPALVELQPHRTTFAPGFPPQQQAFPVPTYTQQQQQQPQQLQVPNHGSTQLMTNNSVTNIQQSQSPVLVNTLSCDNNNNNNKLNFSTIYHPRERETHVESIETRILAVEHVKGEESNVMKLYRRVLIV